MPVFEICDSLLESKWLYIYIYNNFTKIKVNFKVYAGLKTKIKRKIIYKSVKNLKFNKWSI